MTIDLTSLYSFEDVLKLTHTTPRLLEFIVAVKLNRPMRRPAPDSRKRVGQELTPEARDAIRFRPMPMTVDQIAATLRRTRQSLYVPTIRHGRLLDRLPALHMGRGYVFFMPEVKR